MTKKNPAAVSLGRLGGLASGKVKSPAKAAAARENGKKGGRPKKEAKWAGWAAWYAEARDAAKFLGLRRVPLDDYKEQFAMGLAPQKAVDQIFQFRGTR